MMFPLSLAVMPFNKYGNIDHRLCELHFSNCQKIEAMNVGAAVDIGGHVGTKRLTSSRTTLLGFDNTQYT